MLPEDVRKLTRREISDLIDAMGSRKNGYKDQDGSDNVKVSDEMAEKIKKVAKKRFEEIRGRK